MKLKCAIISTVAISLAACSSTDQITNEKRKQSVEAAYMALPLMKTANRHMFLKNNHDILNVSPGQYQLRQELQDISFLFSQLVELSTPIAFVRNIVLSDDVYALSTMWVPAHNQKGDRLISADKAQEYAWNEFEKAFSSIATDHKMKLSCSSPCDSKSKMFTFKNDEETIYLRIVSFGFERPGIDETRDKILGFPAMWKSVNGYGLNICWGRELFKDANGLTKTVTAGNGSTIPVVRCDTRKDTLKDVIYSSLVKRMSEIPGYLFASQKGHQHLIAWKGKLYSIPKHGWYGKLPKDTTTTVSY